MVIDFLVCMFSYFVIIFVIFMEFNYVDRFETSNVLSGHSIHHQGQGKLTDWKRVCSKVESEGLKYRR
jgi:hypothetical protein